VIRVLRTRDPRICQGDVIRDVEWIDSVMEKEGVLEVRKVVFPRVIVLTQDCDLEQDHRSHRPDRKSEDKWLISVLVAPLYNAAHVYTGEHLIELGAHMQQIRSDKLPGQNLRNNETPRYHYLEFPEHVPIVPSVIDFKHYFSVNQESLRRAKRAGFVCSVAPLYREAIAHRFASFLARVGLPDLDGS
jgi:hypothetical protein